MNVQYLILSQNCWIRLVQQNNCNFRGPQVRILPTSPQTRSAFFRSAKYPLVGPQVRKSAKYPRHLSARNAAEYCLFLKSYTMEELDWWMTVENERRLLLWMSCGMFVSAVVMFAVLLIMPAPYGRYSSSSWGPLVDSRCAWFMQELPSLLVPTVSWQFTGVAARLPNKLLLGAFIAHYVHRLFTCYLVIYLLGHSKGMTVTTLQTTRP